MDLIPILLLALAGALALYILSPKGGAPVAAAPRQATKKKAKKPKKKAAAASPARKKAPAPEPEPEPEPEVEKVSKNALKKARQRARARERKAQEEELARQAQQAAKKAARKSKKANKKANKKSSPAAAATDAAALEQEQLAAAAAAASSWDTADAADEAEWEDVSALKKRKKQSPKRGAESKIKSGPTVRKTIDVGDKVPALMGRGGSNVKAIREATGVDINIPRRDENSTVVTVSGSAGAVTRALELIRERISGGSSPRVDDRESRTITIEEDEVRLVIGRGGANIKLIESETGASLNVSKEGTPTVVIRGDGDQLDAAEALIEKVIQGRGRMNGVSETIKLRDGQARIIIGPKGATVNAMKDATGAQLRIQDDHVEIFGTPEQVKLAATSISRLLADYTSAEMEVDGRQCGTIIGSKGATISKLQRDSGASINVDSNSNVVTISGSKAAVSKARSSIIALLEAPRTFTPLPEGVSSETMELGKHASRVIGRKGATVQKIQTDTGAKLDFIEQTCRISGDDEQVEAAREAVQAILDAETKREAEREKQRQEREARQAALELEAQQSPEIDEEDQLGDDEMLAAADW